MKRLVILGTGGNCLDILDAAMAINETAGRLVYGCAGFLDDNPALQGTRQQGLPVLGRLADAARLTDCVFVNGVGSPNNFWRKPAILRTTGVPWERFETIIHPQASVSRFANIGPGSVLLAGAMVGARAMIGAHVIVLQGAIISHDCQVGDFGCVASGGCLSGGVVMEESCYLGANASVRGGVRLGGASLVGIGSVVLRDVAPRHVVAGNPARFLRELAP